MAAYYNALLPFHSSGFTRLMSGRVRPTHVVFAGIIQPLDEAVLVGPPDGFAVNSADVHKRTPILREISDGCGVIYWPACFGVHAHHHSLDIFTGAGLDHEAILEHTFECLYRQSVVTVDAA